MVDLDRRYVRSGAFVARRVAGELLLVPSGEENALVGKRDLLVIGGSGEELWELLVQGGSAEDLVRHLQTTFDVSEAAARADVARFVAELAAAGAIEPAEAQ